MKRVMVSVMVLALLAAGGGLLWAQDDVQKHPACSYCGMDRAKWNFSRVLVVYDDGSEFGACSLHCAAVDFAVNIDKAPQQIHVGDYDTKALIDAETAVWVLGGDKPGVMTKRAKWAFADQAGAQGFVQQHGGEIVDFERALEASYEDMYQDTRMIREKRKMKRMKMGQGKS